MDELVSKRDVILMYKRLVDYEHLDEETFIENVKVLPSVEPKIIRCKDCRHGLMDDDGFIDCVKLTKDTDELGFCSWAERRTDE